MSIEKVGKFQDCITQSWNCQDCVEYIRVPHSWLISYCHFGSWCWYDEHSNNYVVCSYLFQLCIRMCMCTCYIITCTCTMYHVYVHVHVHSVRVCVYMWGGTCVQCFRRPPLQECAVWRSGPPGKPPAGARLAQDALLPQAGENGELCPSYQRTHSIIIMEPLCYIYIVHMYKQGRISLLHCALSPNMNAVFAWGWKGLQDYFCNHTDY